MNAPENLESEPVPTADSRDMSQEEEMNEMYGLDYVDLFVKKGAVTMKFSLRETASDEDKVKTLAQKALGRF